VDLRRILRAGVAMVAVAGLLAPGGVGPSWAAPSLGGVEVHVGEAQDFSRVEFHGAPTAQVKRDGQTLTFTFPRDADPDISRLKASPPRWIRTAEKSHVNGHLQVAITLSDDGDAKTGSADGATYVNAFKKPGPTPEELAAQRARLAPPPRPNPIPAGGVVHMDSRLDGAQVRFTFAWANPAGAAVFRRGDTVWVIFDAPAAIDIGRAPRGLTQYTGLQTVRGKDYTALRIEAAHGLPVSASAVGATWTIALGPGDQGASTLVHVSRDDADGPANLKAPVAGITSILQFTDPQVGDTLDVVTALGPPKGLPARRDFAQLSILPSVQGLAIEPHIDELDVTREGDVIHIGRPLGLALSPSAAPQQVKADLDLPRPAALPGLIDYVNWPKTGSKGFLSRYNALVSAAAAEGANHDKGSPTIARMALARFLVGQELAFEAIGWLNDLAKESPQVMETPEFRGLRGIARVEARRFKEADADFSAPVLAEDPSSALWRAYIASQQAQWTEARTQFAKGSEAFLQFSPTWKARFARADAQAALAQGDLMAADSRIKLALADRTDVWEELTTRLVQARIFEMEGHKETALKMYAAIAGAPRESLASKALLRATQIKLETGKVTAPQAAMVFDGLRYRWRGDATELETIRALGQLYLSQGRYREALEALRSAGSRLPDLPEALQLQADLHAAFRSLFLDGNADGLEPIQALALFQDFQELTPVGADGDLMVRKLVRRLVDVDLLDQAATFLKWQAENRLDGVARAQVATDLAVIYLMDKKPEQAIEAINASRTTVLPNTLNAERRLIEARAWAGVGKFDNALEILGKDASKEAGDVRAEVTWKSHDWAKAGPLFEKALADRWKDPAPLSAEEEGKLLRAGVAYSLAGDDAALGRLNGQYQRYFDQAHNPEALRIALTGVSTNHLSVADFSRVSADNEAFSGWVAKMKVRFHTAPVPVGSGKVPLHALSAPVASQPAQTSTQTPAKASGKQAQAQTKPPTPSAKG
jgi:tetratricopeptide (TPR) repeat protein